MSPRYWLAAMMVVALVGPAFAGDSECSFMEIAATKTDKPQLDPELKPLEKKFKKAPFSAWNNFKKLSTGAASLTKNKPEALNDAAGKRVLEAKPAFKAGDWLMLGGPGASNDDGHILALTCK